MQALFVGRILPVRKSPHEFGGLIIGFFPTKTVMVGVGRCQGVHIEGGVSEGDGEGVMHNEGVGVKYAMIVPSVDLQNVCQPQ